jgi:bacterioferritin-associated ferredoxin
MPQDAHYDPPIDPAIPVSSHLTAIAEAAQNHALLQEANKQHQPSLSPMFSEPNMQQPPDPTLLQEPPAQEAKVASSSSETSMNGNLQSFRETTPSLGKRPADDLDRLATGIKPKRKPKEKWAHRLGCPFRKCRGDMFTTEHGYRVCETTPHEFIIRLIEHMKRNHDLYVCGECFLGFKTPDALNSHKGTGHHCGKCYMSFPNLEEFVQHSNSCMAVDAATQEDIWQILYETLCADGVRHNPSFDDDTPVNGAVQPNNRVRMQFLSQQPLAPGQVPSLARRLGSSASGNGVAPPVERAEEQRQQLVPVGTNTLQAAPSRARSPPMGREAQLLSENYSQRDTIQVLQGLLAIERQARFEAEVRADFFATARVHDIVQSAVRHFVSSIRRRRPEPVKPRYESGWLEEIPELNGESVDDVDIMTLAPVRPSPIPFIDDFPATTATMELPNMILPEPNALPNALQCPSLTSESTAQSLQDLTVPLLLNLPWTVMYSCSKDDTQEPAFTWGQPWSCQRCGAELRKASDVFCEACAALDWR